MKINTLFSCLVLLFCSLTMSAQWQTLSWLPEVQATCDDADSIRTISGGKAYFAFSTLDGAKCLDAELDADNQTIHLASTDSMRGEFIIMDFTGSATNIGSQPITPPWGPGEFGLLSVRLNSTSFDIFLDPPTSQGILSTQVIDEIYGQQYAKQRYSSAIGRGNDQHCLLGLVEGGESLYTSSLVFYVKEGPNIPIEVDFQLEYLFERIDGRVYTEYYAPVSSFDGNVYLHEFDEFYTTLQLDNLTYRFDVGLEENTPEAQDIVFKKDGGVIALLVQEAEIQTSTVSQEPHRLSFDLTDVEFCLDGEMVFPEGSSVKSTGTKYSFRDTSSCLGILPESSFTFASGTHDDFAADGAGMLLLYGTSEVHLEENAELSFGGVFALRETETSIPKIILEEGARLVITETASVYSRRRTDLRYKIQVVTNDGATFDMSAANAEVQELFEVTDDYPSHSTIEKTAYAIFPNPVVGNIVTVRRGVDALPISRIEVVDVVGRTLKTSEISYADERVEVTLPSAGLYFISVTDIFGATTILPVLSK